MKRNNRFGIAAAALSGFALMLVFLYLSVSSVAYREAWYSRTQDRLGVVEAERDEMNREMAEYLSGERASLSERFNMQERLHMQDVVKLFSGGRKIALCAGLLWAAGLLTACRLLPVSRALKGMVSGFGIFLWLLAFFGLWAALDFDAWFTTMHQWVFTNDLWLFDPAQSKMIRILPLEFFVAAVTAIAVRFAGMAALCAGGCLAMGKGLKKHDL